MVAITTKMQRIILGLAIVILSSCSACKTETVEPELPAYTETGANTFGCRINGELYYPKVPLGSMIAPLKCRYQIVNDTPYFSLFVAQQNPDVFFYLNMEKITLNRDTVLRFGRTENTYLLGRVLKEGIEHKTADEASGELHIRHLDFMHQIMSGTFWFNAGLNHEIKVTEGRFDVRFTR